MSDDTTDKTYTRAVAYFAHKERRLALYKGLLAVAMVVIGFAMFLLGVWSQGGI